MKEVFGNEPVELIRELQNFEEIAKYLVPSPGDLPELAGVDVYGRSIPLDGLVGGDHIIYIDFKKRYDLEARIEKAVASGRKSVAENLTRCRSKAGIALADVSGHRITDALLALMLHQAFLLGSIYEMDYCGEITTRLFENLNTRFFKSSSVGKFVTLIYGEISEQGDFSFISAAHPPPVVFSAKFDRIVEISPELLTTYPPIGTMPSYEDIDRKTSHTVLGFKERYKINEISLMGLGDIMILYSDGVSEHCNDSGDYFPGRLEAKLREVKALSAREIFEAIHADMMDFSRPSDDISFVVVKRR